MTAAAQQEPHVMPPTGLVLRWPLPRDRSRVAVPSTLSTDHPLAVTAVQAIHTGDLDALRRLLADNPGLATARLGDDREARTLLTTSDP